MEVWQCHIQIYLYVNIGIISCSQLLALEWNHVGIKAQSCKPTKCRHKLIVNGVAPGSATDHKTSCPGAPLIYFFTLAINDSTPTSNNEYSIVQVGRDLKVHCWVTLSVQESPSITVCWSESHGCVWTQMDFGQCTDRQRRRQNVLAPLAATQVPLEGKQRRCLL